MAKRGRKPKKEPEELTDDEIMPKLFPKRAINRVRKEAEESGLKAKKLKKTGGSD